MENLIDLAAKNEETRSMKKESSVARLGAFS